MAKITLREWLVGLTVLPKGTHQHYRSEYIIDCSDIEKIYSDMEELAEQNSSAWAVECDPINHTICTRKKAGINVLGQQLVHQQKNHAYALTEDNKVYVIDEEWDYEHCNARFNIEVNLKKLRMKKYGSITDVKSAR